MGHTNTTTNYALPQFITTDKPAWLTDINGAFATIDAAVYNAKDAADSAQNDATQALSDASSASTAAASADGKGSGALASIAAAFDPTTIYDVGDYVIYNSLLYICSVAVVTPGPWTGSTNWTRATTPKTADDIAYDSSETYSTGSIGKAVQDIPVFKTGHLNTGGISINNHYTSGDMYYADVSLPSSWTDVDELLAVTMTDYGGLSNTLQFQIKPGLVIRIWSKTAQTLSSLWLKVLYKST